MSDITEIINYGRAKLNAAGVKFATQFAAGREVLYLGSGNGELSRLLVEVGATAVVAIDSCEMPKIGGVQSIQCAFEDIHSLSLPKRVLFSWPASSVTTAAANSLKGFLAGVEQVLYIGRNDKTTQCGWTELWEELRTREVLGHVEVDNHNTAILYGVRLDERRFRDQLLPEERRAFDNCEAGLKKAAV